MSGITRFRLDCAETAIKVTVEVNWVSKMRIYIILLHLITIAQIRVKQFRRGAETKLLCTDVCGLYSSDASSSEAPMWGGCTCFSYISSFVSVNTT